MWFHRGGVGGGEELEWRGEVGTRDGEGREWWREEGKDVNHGGGAVPVSRLKKKPEKYRTLSSIADLVTTLKTRVDALEALSVFVNRPTARLVLRTLVGNDANALKREDLLEKVLSVSGITRPLAERIVGEYSDSKSILIAEVRHVRWAHSWIRFLDLFPGSSIPWTQSGFRIRFRVLSDNPLCHRAGVSGITRPLAERIVGEYSDSKSILIAEVRHVRWAHSWIRFLGLYRPFPGRNPISESGS